MDNSIQKVYINKLYNDGYRLEQELQNAALDIRYKLGTNIQAIAEVDKIHDNIMKLANVHTLVNMGTSKMHEAGIGLSRMSRNYTDCLGSIFDILRFKNETDRFVSSLSSIIDIAQNILAIEDSYEFRLLNGYRLSEERKMQLLSSAESIEIPFDNICVTQQKEDNTFSNIVLLLLKDNIKLMLNNQKYVAYCLAAADARRGYKEIKEQIYIPELHPRIIMECPEESNCTNKNMRAYNIENIEGKTISTDYCLISPRTIHRCAGCNMDKSMEAMYTVLATVLDVVDKFNRRHKLQSTTGQGLPIQTNNTPRNKTTTNENKSQAGFIVINTKTDEVIAHYRNGRFHRVTPGTHASPHEHIRKQHIRHYKSGKIVVIKQTVVNEGKEKMVYAFK